MNAIDAKTTLFCIPGNKVEDISLHGVPIKLNGINLETFIENESNEGTRIQCMNFSLGTQYLTMTINPDFFGESFTIEWWEKDMDIMGALSSVFTNTTGSSDKGFGYPNNESNREGINMSANNNTYFAQDFITGNAIADKWTHRATVYDKEAGHYRFYENGKVFSVLEKGESCHKDGGFQMGRWRTSANALSKKVYNFAIQKGKKYGADEVFEAPKENFVFEEKPLDTTIKTGIDVDTEFCLRGNALEDASSKKALVRHMGDANVKYEENDGVPVNCYVFNNDASTTRFYMDGTVFQNPYTMEWWEKDIDVKYGTVSTLISSTDNGTGNKGFSVGSKSGQRNSFWLSINGDKDDYNGIKIGNDIANEWVHRAVVFTGEKYLFFENGALYTAIETNKIPKARDGFYIGRFCSASNSIKKKIYNVRISRIARYTEEGFSIPQKVLYDIEKKSSVEHLSINSSIDDVIDKLDEIAQTIPLGAGLELEDVTPDEEFATDFSLKPIINLGIKESQGQTVRPYKIVNVADRKNDFIVRSRKDASIGVSDDNFYFSGESWATGYIQDSRQGAILLRFNAYPANSFTYDANGNKVESPYGGVFRFDSDGLSLFANRGADKFTIKIYNVNLGGTVHSKYIDFAIEEIRNKRMLINFDIDKNKCDIYVDGTYLKSVDGDIYAPAYQVSTMVSLGDDRKKNEAHKGYNLPKNLYEFKMFPKFLENEAQIKEAFDYEAKA